VITIGSHVTALIKRLAMRRKIRGVSAEELAANPLFTSRPQAPL
jgi:hypothetical protein